MFARARCLAPRTPVVSLLNSNPLHSTQVRHGSGAALLLRIRSVRNIAKITKAMKMVATARLRRSQLRLEQARKFTQFITPVWPDPAQPPKGPHNSYLLVPLSTDRGLCGGVNTVIAREARARLTAADERGDKKVSVITYGEKSRAALEMQWRRFFVATIGESGKSHPLSFDQVLELTDLIFAQKADVVEVIWNRFKSLLVYETNVASFYSYATAFDHNHFLAHEREGDNELFENLYQYRFACRLWGFLKELETVELSSRMNAMTSSNKNANEMGQKLWLKYSRMRQDKITTELVEIISGAISVEEGQGKD